MEKHRLSHERRTMLLPVSYGLSSSVLLHLLHVQIERQNSRPSRFPGYNLHVLVVEPSSICSSNPSDEQKFGLIQKYFPGHSYTRAPLHSIFEVDPDIQKTLSEFAGPSFVDDLSLSPKERLDAFRASIPTATSKTDVDYALMNRLVVAYTKKLDCTAVLWGDSDSRLAAKTLANVAKGRGSALTWQVCDGMSPSGLEFNFPLRDLYRKELQSYAELYPELTEIIVPEEPPSDNMLTKNLSIDELMMRYVLTQGEKYPGVMANVTRTASKLEPSKASPDAPHCAFCTALIRGPEGKSKGMTAADSLKEDQNSQFCYGCARSRPDLAC